MKHINIVFVHDWKRWRLVANADNSYQSKRNDSVNIIMNPTWSSKMFYLFFSIFYLLGSADILKFLV